MAYKILSGSAQFKYAMSDPDDLRNWLALNPNIVGLSFVGRSNVGKSSLINALFGKNSARTSKTPGRTRSVNIFTFNLTHNGKVDACLPPLYFFDLPGYGHANVSKEMSRNWNQLMAVFFEFLGKQITMINLQDARHPNQKADQAFHAFLKNYPFDTTLVFNKMDKLKTQKERAALNKLKPKISKDYRWVKHIHFVSAEKRTGIKELHDALIGHLLERLEQLTQNHSS